MSEDDAAFWEKRSAGMKCPEASRAKSAADGTPVAAQMNAFPDPLWPAQQDATWMARLAERGKMAGFMVVDGEATLFPTVCGNWNDGRCGCAGCAHARAVEAELEALRAADRAAEAEEAAERRAAEAADAALLRAVFRSALVGTTLGVAVCAAMLALMTFVRWLFH